MYNDVIFTSKQIHEFMHLLCQMQMYKEIQALPVISCVSECLNKLLHR